MIILPAIDIKDGKCVRLFRGDYDTAHQVAEDAVKTAQGFEKAGAVLKLEQGDRDEISAKMRSYNESRREKQPLNFPSAGSAFKRPEGYFAAALIDEYESHQSHFQILRKS